MTVKNIENLPDEVRVLALIDGNKIQIGRRFRDTKGILRVVWEISRSQITKHQLFLSPYDSETLKA